MYPVISSYLYHQKQACFLFLFIEKYVMIIIQNVRWAWIV